MAERLPEQEKSSNGNGAPISGAQTFPATMPNCPVALSAKPLNHSETNAHMPRPMPAPLDTILAKAGSPSSSSSGPATPGTPQPSTPIGAPVSGGDLSPIPANSPAHDLPMELLQAGWRKFWSRRENRPYFFNKFTNESRWEMPTVGIGSVST